MHSSPLNRRDFLRLSACTGMGVALGGAGLLTGCGPVPLSLPITTMPLGGGLDVPGTPSVTPATVAAVRGTDLRAMTWKALEALGGIGSIVRPGETVFIKPNFLTAGMQHVNPTWTGECAKPEIALTVAEACLQAGAARVTIGDGAQEMQFAWEELTTLDGATHMAAEAARLNAAYDNRLTLACLNGDSPDWIAVPSPRTKLGQVYVSSLVMQADRVISIPVLKSHREAHVSLSMKNFVGTTPLARYRLAINERSQLHNVEGGVLGAALDIVDAVKPDLALIDGSVGVEGQGPWVQPGQGVTVDLRERAGQWFLLASTDLLAADVTTARIIGQDYAAVPYLQKAYEQGLGQAREDLIALRGAALDELRVEWELARVGP